MKNKRTVFISHSSKDEKIANSLCDFLEKAGLNCWVASRDIFAGKDYPSSIIDALDNAAVVILIFSEHSNGSDHVSNEIELAFKKRIKIIPFRIADIEPSQSLEYFLSRKHWLNAFEKKPSAYFNDVQKICDQLIHQTENPENPVERPSLDENIYLKKSIQIKKRNLILYSFGVIAVSLTGYFIWISQATISIKPVKSNSGSIAVNEKKTSVLRSSSNLENSNDKIEKATSKKQNQHSPGPSAGKSKEENATSPEILSLHENDYFDNASDNEDYLRFHKKSGNIYAFEGKISGKSVSGDAKFKGHEQFAIEKNNTIKGSFFINGNELTGDIALLAVGYDFKPKRFILYGVI